MQTVCMCRCEPYKSAALSRSSYVSLGTRGCNTVAEGRVISAPIIATLLRIMTITTSLDEDNQSTQKKGQQNKIHRGGAKKKGIKKRMKMTQPFWLASATLIHTFSSFFVSRFLDKPCIAGQHLPSALHGDI